MAKIKRVRLANIIYDNGNKRYNDTIFDFDGEHSIILLQNGLGKTVFIQLLLQTIIPHIDIAGRKIKDTLNLLGQPAHIAVEWELAKNPGVYGTTAVSLYQENQDLKSIRYVYQYNALESDYLERIPFSIQEGEGKRPASKYEIVEYYNEQKKNSMMARTFDTIKEYCDYLERELNISPEQWRKIALINKEEGGMDAFFKHCSTTKLLIDNLLIPVTADVILQDDDKFVNTFESQRENFKINKELTEQINKLKSVNLEMNKYIKAYAKHHEQGLACDYALLHVQRIKEHILALIAETIAKQEKLDKQAVELAEKIRENQYQQVSLQIYQQEVKLEQITREQGEKRECLQQEEAHYQQYAQRYQNIQFSHWQGILAEESERIVLLQKQIADLDQEQDLTEIRSQRDQTLAYIKGHYQQLLEQLMRKIAELDRELEGRLEEIASLKQQGLEQQKNYRALIENSAGLKGEIKSLEENREKLKQSIALNSDMEIDQLIWEINKRTRELQGLFVSIDHRLAELKLAQKNKLALKQQTQQKLNLVAVERERLFTQMQELDKAALRIMTLVADYDLQFRFNDSNDLYLKESKLLERLREDKNRLQHIYEENVAKEKIESRLYSLYQDSSYFMADPLVEQIVEKLELQLSDVSSGTQYVQKYLLDGMGNEVELYQKYPFWAISIVVNQGELAKAEAIIQSFDGEMTNQLILLTKEELKEIMLNGELKSHRMIFPKLWQENLRPEQFSTWKGMIKEGAEKAKKELQQSYDNLSRLQALWQKVDEFYKENSFEDYQHRKGELSALEVDSQHLAKEINTMDYQIAELSKEQEKQWKDKENLQTEYDVQKSRAEKAKEYKQIVEKVNNFREKLESLETEKALQGAKQKKLEREIDAQLYQKELLTQEKSDHWNRVSILQESEWYKKSLACAARFSDKKIEVLIEAYQNLLEQLKGISSERNGLEQQLLQAEKSQLRAKQEGERLTREAKYPLEILSIFDSNQLEQLAKKKRELEGRMEGLKSELHQLDIQWEVVNHDKENLTAKLAAEGYGERYQFLLAIAIEEERIEGEASVYQKQQSEQAEIRQQLAEQLEEDKELEKKLGYAEAENKKAMVYTDKSKYSLDEDNAQLDYQYNKSLVVKRAIDGLEKQFQLFQASQVEIQREFKAYEEYCQHNIDHPTLKEACIKSIARCENFDELQQVQTNLTERLNRAMNIASENIRQSEADLQMFLNHLISFCGRILDEIKSIQAKTRIKTKKSQKSESIYDFMMPKYQPEIAKRQIRHYLDRLIEKYDKPEWREKTSAERRNMLKKDLSATQLLWKSLGDQSIRIRCRKVNSHTELSRSFYEWETSQKWSGGEGWSKNMALFLAILNYVEEKKIINKSKGNCVILDNPFGKASSEHVLYPVFEIAGKLGYQIIALTAHAEGKFVSDFFPVVYSGVGKGSAAGDGSVQILDFEKHTIDTAYLRQKDFFQQNRVEN